MKKYTRISFEEREKIYLLQKQEINITSIGKELGRHKSSISKELKKCKGDPLGYIPDRAHAMYRAGLSRNKALFLNPNLQDYVISKLTISRWTPKRNIDEFKARRSRTEGISRAYLSIYLQQNCFEI